MTFAIYSGVRAVCSSEKSTQQRPIKVVLLSTDGLLVIGAVGGGALVLVTSLSLCGGVNAWVLLPEIVLFGSAGVVVGSDIVVIVLLSLKKTSEKKEQNPLLSFEMKAFSALGASYEDADPSANADLVYCDGDLKFACVVDGAGCNNPRMRKGLKAHFDRFIKSYERDLKEENPSNQERMEKFFDKKIRELEQQFRNPDLKLNKKKICPEEDETEDPIQGTFLDSDFKPAMTFIQIIKKGDSFFVLLAQAGDTVAFLEQTDVFEKILNSNLINVGQEGDLISIPTLYLEVVDPIRVIGFSNGIGEYITYNELEEVVKATESDRLFESLYKKVKSTRSSDGKEVAANGAPLKAFDPKRVGHVDDMSLFVLEFSETASTPTDDH